MNAQAILLAPWRATHAPLRWLSLCVVALCVLGGIVLATFSHKGEPAWMLVGAYDVALVYMWAFFLCSAALLGIDARWLCVPGMQRAAVQSVLFYAALSLLPTWLIAQVHGSDTAPMMLVSALCVLAGLCFALLPRYVSLIMGVLPAMFSSLSRQYDLPHVGDPRFLPWGGTLAAVLATLCVLRWRSIVRTAPQHQQGFSGPMVLQYRSRQWAGGAMNGVDSTTQVRQRPDWMQPHPDLRHAGPQQPGNAMRVALGGWYLPRTLLGHLQGLLPGLLIFCVPATTLLLIYNDKHTISLHALWPLAVLLIGWVAMFGSMGVVFSTLMLVQQRWRKANAELPLLALLPGLGDAASSKHRMLVTTLRRPLVAQACALIGLLALTLPSHPAAISVATLIAGQVGCVAALVACVLCVLGGRPLSTWATFALMITISLLIGLNSFVPNSMVGSHPWTPSLSFALPVLAGWFVVCAILAWVGARGWRAWRERPHAFMPNG